MYECPTREGKAETVPGTKHDSGERSLNVRSELVLRQRPMESLPPRVGGRRVFRLRGRSRASGPSRARAPIWLRWSLILFVMAFPFETVDIGLGSSLSMSRLAGLPFFFLCLFAPKLCFRAPSPAAWLFFAYLGVVAVAALYTPPDLRAGVLFTMIQLVVFFWIATNVFRDRQLAAQTMRAYAVATVALAVGIVAALPGFADSIPTGKARLSALDYNPNGLATVAAIGAVIVLGAFLNAVRLRDRLFLGAAAVPLVILIIRTGSRSGALSLVAGLAVFLTPAGGMRRRIAAIGLAGVLFLGALYLIAKDPLMGARFGATIEEGDSAGRDKIYAAALGMVSERPLVGWGPGYGLYELGKRLNIAWSRDTHNLVLYLMLEGGLLETVPFLMGLWLVVRAAWRGRYGPFGVVPLAMIAVVLTANVSHTYLVSKPIWLALAIGLASARLGRAQRVMPRREEARRRIGAAGILVGGRNS